jgi:tRNA(Glu) U13 pseudouridine synthase TruD
MTDKINNMFYIRLRANQAIGQKDKENIQKRVTELLAKGFPNFFGDQRFGINFQNINM